MENQCFPEISPDHSRKIIGQKLRETIPRSCQRILLINPQTIPKEDFLPEQVLHKRYWTYQPYGCMILACNLEQRGYFTSILDLNFELITAARRDREEFRYDFWKDLLRQRLEQFQPQVAGISCMFTMTHGVMKEIADEIKRSCPTLPVFAGGVHVSNASRLILLDCPSLDFIGLYEGDVSFPDIIDFINDRIPLDRLTQIATLVGKDYVAVEERVTPDVRAINAIPLYRDLLIADFDEIGQIGTYGFMRPGRKAASVLSNRGCRAHCSFCSVASFNGPGVRMRSVESVAEEIEILNKEYGIRHITWLDDDLLFNKPRTLDLFREITRRRLDITWDASNGLIVAAITPEIMKAMAESGCLGFNLGLESGNPEILKKIHKPGTVESFRKAKRIVDQYPEIFIKGFLIIGFPDETLRQILDTVNFSLELAFDWYAVQLLNLLPSTEMYQEMIERGLIEDNLQTSDVAFVFGPHGRQRLQEEREKLSAHDFFNLFNVCDLDAVPEQKDLGDYWFLTDYKLNYEIILGLRNPAKLKKKALILNDICRRIAPENPLAHLFLGIISQKSGQNAEAQNYADTVERLVNESRYWQKRFDALELYDLLSSLRQQKFPRLF